LALYGEQLNLLLRNGNGLANSLIEKSEDVRFATVAMKDCGVHGIGHKHVGPNANCYFVVAFSVEAQAFLLGLPKGDYVDLD
jgi:hypothetical protein